MLNKISKYITKTTTDVLLMTIFPCLKWECPISAVLGAMAIGRPHNRASSRQ